MSSKWVQFKKYLETRLTNLREIHETYNWGEHSAVEDRLMQEIHDYFQILVHMKEMEVKRG